MVMPQEEIKKQQEQIATGGEGPGREATASVWGFFMPYLLQRLDGIEAGISSRIDRVETNLRGEIKQLDAKVETVDAKVDTVETNLRGEIKQLDDKVGTVETNLRGEINSQVGGLRGEMAGLRGEMAGLRQETTTRIDSVNARMDGLQQEIRSTPRWAIGTIIAVVVGLAGVIASLLAVCWPGCRNLRRGEIGQVEGKVDKLHGETSSLVHRQGQPFPRWRVSS